MLHNATKSTAKSRPNWRRRRGTNATKAPPTRKENIYLNNNNEARLKPVGHTRQEREWVRANMIILDENRHTLSCVTTSNTATSLQLFSPSSVRAIPCLRRKYLSEPRYVAPPNRDIIVANRRPDATVAYRAFSGPMLPLSAYVTGPLTDGSVRQLRAI